MKRSEIKGYIPGWEGDVFKEESGKLYVFSKSSVHVMKAWPQPMAWKKTTKEYPNWVRFRPTLRHLDHQVMKINDPNYQWIIDEPSPEYQWWVSTVPKEVRVLIEQFPKRKWHMLSFLASCGKPGFDLAEQNPALAFALASNWVFHKPAVKRPLRSARALLKPGRKQTDILRWLGFPPTKSVCRIFKKYQAKDVSIPGLLILQDILREPKFVKLLSHQKEINTFLLTLLSRKTRDWITVKLFQDLMNEMKKGKNEDSINKWREVLIIMRDTVEMYQKVYPNKPIPVLEKATKLQELHNHLVREIHKLTYKNISFSPPLPGTNDILPLDSAKLLHEEGVQQHHCAASYIERVRLGKSFLYRILSPERCTAELYKTSDGAWRLSQLKGAFNKDPSVETVTAVKKWLSVARKQTKK